MVMGDYELASVDAKTLAVLVAPLAHLYRRSFSGPPWHEGEERFAGFADRLTAHLAVSGAHGVVAWHGDKVAGVVYGWPAAAKVPDSSFYADVYGAVDPVEHHLLMAPSLEIAELMVDPGHRSRGLGRALLTRLADPHPQTWFCTHPDAPARSLFESEGWAALGAYSNDDGTPRVVMSRRTSPVSGLR